MKSRFKLSSRWLTILVALALLAAGLEFFRARGKGQIEFTTSAAGMGTIRSTVTATGVVEAVRTVQVGTQVSGIIASLHADFNSTVRKGQVIAQIDVENRDFKLRPGLTANLILTTAERASVLLVPNTALRFTPPDGARLTANPAPAGARTVWVLGADRQPQPRAIVTGITDGAFTEVVGGDMRPGEALITGQK